MSSSFSSWLRHASIALAVAQSVSWTARATEGAPASADTSAAEDAPVTASTATTVSPQGTPATTATTAEVQPEFADLESVLVLPFDDGMGGDNESPVQVVVRRDDGSVVQPGQTTPAAADVPTAETASPPPTDLPKLAVKGELSSLGNTRLQVRDTRVGLRLGVTQFGDKTYVAGSAELDLRLGSFILGLAAPVRVLAYDPAQGLQGFFPDGLKVRSQDYDEPSEWIRWIRYLNYGRKEDSLYVNVGTETTQTLGHGSVVRRYLSNSDIDRGRIAAEVDMYGKWGGAEVFVGDVLRPDRMVGAIGFVKPLASTALPLALRRLSVGVTHAGDYEAPYTLKADADGRALIVDGSLQVQETRAAQVTGVTIETKVLQSARADIKPFLDVSRLWGGGTGFTLGTLGRWNFDEGRSAVRAVIEGRLFQGNYLPGYFDTFYQIQRSQFVKGGDSSTPLVPKLAEVLSRKADWTPGMYAELQYATRSGFALTGVWEDSSAPAGRNVALHAELPRSSTLRMFATVHRRSMTAEDPTGLAAPLSQQLKADNTLFVAGARVRLLPLTYLNARAFRLWRFDPADNQRQFRNVNGLELDLEIGWDGSRSSDT